MVATEEPVVLPDDAEVQSGTWSIDASGLSTSDTGVCRASLATGPDDGQTYSVEVEPNTTNVVGAVDAIAGIYFGVDGESSWTVGVRVEADGESSTGFKRQLTLLREVDASTTSVIDSTDAVEHDGAPVTVNLKLVTTDAATSIVAWVDEDEGTKAYALTHTHDALMPTSGIGVEARSSDPADSVACTFTGPQWLRRTSTVEERTFVYGCLDELQAIHGAEETDFEYYPWGGLHIKRNALTNEVIEEYSFSSTPTPTPHPTLSYCTSYCLVNYPFSEPGQTSGTRTPAPRS